jgi:hypothetical protein
MGHHRHREPNEIKEYQELPSEEREVQNVHPFFQGNDLAILSVICPFLSQNGQKIISFFMNFGGDNGANNSPASDIAGLLMQTLKNVDPNFLQSLLPQFLNSPGNSSVSEVLQRFLPKGVPGSSPTS